MYLLLIDDSSAARQACRAAAPECVVEQRRSSLEALTYLRSRPTPLVLVGSLCSRYMDTLGFVRELLREFPGTDIILLPTESSEAAAIAAFRAGAWDYLAGGPNPENIRSAVQRWQLCRLGHVSEDPVRAERIIGCGNWIQSLRTHVAQLATSNCSVLITGETGTGKEVVAEAIHAQGSRQNKPFMCINCAAVPDALFESEIFGSERGAYTGSVATREGKLRQAHGGTVFFDEIGEMSLVSQAKILRAIETRSIQRLGGSETLALDVRIVAATNQPLEKLCGQNLFRRDLYYRINVARLELLPLRERPEDIAELVNHFLRQFNVSCRHVMRGFSSEAMEALQRYSWPGNVRELRNAVEVALATCHERHGRLAHLPASILHEVKSYTAPRSSDRETLLQALHAVNWNKSAAAQSLNWSRMTLYRKMAEHGIGADIKGGMGRLPSAIGSRHQH